METRNKLTILWFKLTNSFSVAAFFFELDSRWDDDGWCDWWWVWLLWLLLVRTGISSWVCVRCLLKGLSFLTRSILFFRFDEKEEVGFLIFFFFYVFVIFIFIFIFIFVFMFLSRPFEMCLKIFFFNIFSLKLYCGNNFFSRSLLIVLQMGPRFCVS